MAEKKKKRESDEEGEDGCRKRAASLPFVTIIVPVHNCVDVLDECFQSLLHQTYMGPMEVSVFVDGCKDASHEKCLEWQPKFESDDRFSWSLLQSDKALGAGRARNRAIAASRGEMICIQDADDISMPSRVEEQVEACKRFPQAIIGTNFERIPADATERYARWCNSLSHEQLFLHRFRELPIIQPTWFFRREVWERVGGYPETCDLEQDRVPETFALADLTHRKDGEQPGEDTNALCAEDMRFFYKHLRYCEKNGIELMNTLYVVRKNLVQYRFLSESMSWRTPRKLLFRIKVKAFEDSIIKNEWETFTIWGAGRDGKDFFKLLSEENQNKVVAMCDIDPVKIKNGYHNRALKKTVPVVHFSQAKPPIVCCVAMDRGGEFEENLRSLNLQEGKDYYHFC